MAFHHKFEVETFNLSGIWVNLVVSGNTELLKTPAYGHVCRHGKDVSRGEGKLSTVFQSISVK